MRDEIVTSKRILIVEDQAEILEAYRDILKPKPKAAGIKSSRSSASPSDSAEVNPREDIFELTLVNNGEEAVQTIKKARADHKPFAMGFFDVLLGTGIDGIETIRQIHLIDPEMYAVLVTAYQDRHVDSIHTIFGKEFEDRWDYLNKPFSEGEILQKARNMVSMWNVRQRERSLRRRLAETEKLLTIAAVARSVGHEFGNILLQIMGRADLSRTGDETEMRTALETILKASEHAGNVLQRFKGLARPQEDVEVRAVSLLTLVQETLLLIGHEIKRRDVDAVVEISPEMTIQGNSTMLLQVLMNLVINALYAIDKGPGKIFFQCQKNGKEVELKVRDTGPGIAPENLDNIFQPFFTTKGEHGTGLGLAICREIIEINHAGRMTVINHPSGGAEFTLAFPAGT